MHDIDKGFLSVCLSVQYIVETGIGLLYAVKEFFSPLSKATMHSPPFVTVTVTA